MPSSTPDDDRAGLRPILVRPGPAKAGVALACFMCWERAGAISTPDGLACIPCVQLCVHLVVRRCHSENAQRSEMQGICATARGAAHG